MATDRIGYRVSPELWYLPLAEAKWAVEAANSILIQLGEKSQANLGAILVIGEYPYGVNWHVLPTCDVVFQW